MHTRIIRQYYVLSFLSSTLGMQIISAIYATFLMKNGLSLFQVNLVNAVYFTTLFVCELPTGAFADIFGRKTSYLVSTALVSVYMFVYGSSHTIFGFVCAEMIAAVGTTFKTGAFQAWLVDSLGHHGYTGPFNKIFGRSSLYNQVGAGLGAVLGSYLSVVHLSLPWFVGGVGMTLVTIIALVTMREEYFERVAFSWRNGISSMWDLAISSIRYGSQDKAVRFILVVTFVQIYSVQAINMYWQPFFRTKGVMDEHLGFIFSGMMFFIAIGAYVASRVDVEGRERTMIVLSMVYVGVTVALASVVPTKSLAVAIFVVHEVGRGFWSPMVDSYLHKRILPHERATVMSFCSIAPHIGGSIGLLVSGLVAQVFGIRVAWIVASVVLLLGAFFVRKNGESTN